MCGGGFTHDPPGFGSVLALLGFESDKWRYFRLTPTLDAPHASVYHAQKIPHQNFGGFRDH